MAYSARHLHGCLRSSVYNSCACILSRISSIIR
jgi:hypothetical protein